MSELNETMDQTVSAMVERGGKYLTFTLADEEYGIGILKIKEIIGMMPITTVIMGKNHIIRHITTHPITAIPFSTTNGEFTIEVCFE